MPPVILDCLLCSFAVGAPVSYRHAASLFLEIQLVHGNFRSHFCFLR